MLLNNFYEKMKSEQQGDSWIKTIYSDIVKNDKNSQYYDYTISNGLLHKVFLLDGKERIVIKVCLPASIAKEVIHDLPQ